MNLLDRVFETYKYELLAKNNILGVGIGYKYLNNKKTKAIGIVTLVKKKIPLALLDTKDIVPNKLKGVMTDVWETGSLQNYQSRRGVLRPAFPGCSISHFRSPGAGTLGAVVKNIKNELLILSNNHVLANLTNGKDNRSKVGDAIIQPGSLDGGTEKNTIGYLKSFIPLNYGNTENNPQIVDAALAELSNPKIIDSRILNIGIVVKVGEPRLGQSVFKSGRGSGLTAGEIVANKVMLKVLYESDLQAEVIFEDQFLATTSAYPGDSGSLLVATDDRKALGLLVGGGGGIDVYNKISKVFTALRIGF